MKISFKEWLAEATAGAWYRPTGPGAFSIMRWRGMEAHGKSPWQKFFIRQAGRVGQMMTSIYSKAAQEIGLTPTSYYMHDPLQSAEDIRDTDQGLSLNVTIKTSELGNPKDETQANKMGLAYVIKSFTNNPEFMKTSQEDKLDMRRMSVHYLRPLEPDAENTETRLVFHVTIPRMPEDDKDVKTVNL